MSNKLGQLVIELAADSARLQKDLGRAVGVVEKGAAQMKKAFAFIGAGVGGGIIASSFISAAKAAISFGDDLNKAAIKSGIGVKAMSELAYAAKLADVDLGSLSVALKKMQVAVSEAGSGSKQAQGTLAALGLTFDQIQKRKPEAQFELIADRISKLVSPADKARAATELFGKAGVDLLPLFEQGAAGIAKATAEARKLGLSFAEGDIQSLSNADDAIKRLSASWEGFAATMTAKVAPALSDVLDRLSGVDTRSAEVQVASISKTLANMQGLIGPEFEKQRKDLQDRLARAQLQVAIDTQNRVGTGTFGGPGTRGDDGTAIGFARADAEAQRAEAAKKTADAEAKEYERMNASIVASAEWASNQTSDIVQDDLDEWTQAEVDREKMAEDFAEKQIQLEEDVRKWRESQISASAAFFKDSFLQAFDDWINTGKFKFDQFLKYLVAEWSRKWISNALNDAFGSSSSSGGGGFASALGSLFGGGGGSVDGKASGGPVRAGQTYLVGERGMELFKPSTSGSIVPNHALGGNVFHIDASLTINGGENGLSRAEYQAGQKEQVRRIFDEIDRRGMSRAA